MGASRLCATLVSSQSNSQLLRCCNTWVLLRGTSATRFMLQFLTVIQQLLQLQPPSAALLKSTVLLKPASLFLLTDSASCITAALLVMTSTCVLRL